MRVTRIVFAVVYHHSRTPVYGHDCMWCSRHRRRLDRLTDMVLQRRTERSQLTLEFSIIGH